MVASALFGRLAMDSINFPTVMLSGDGPTVLSSTLTTSCTVNCCGANGGGGGEGLGGGGEGGGGDGEGGGGEGGGGEGEGGGGEGEGGGGEGKGGGGEGEGGGGEGGAGGSVGNESGKRQASCCAAIWQAVSELCRARCSGSLSMRSDD